ncbi:hypothetical protein [Chitinophaga sp. S165]|uniref:hypothetical protein n=1 Tax=Chitinophaga sp. S165 TaxID=2135462 RepID=UPI000D715B92|nr:hypothetical protein [Chitinophaga sp. S165]PWV55565.1 hypothetical protein C7475_10171 [Chitinophaga sp. S165]
MKHKLFPLENVLAVALDRALTANKYGVLDLCSFVIGKEVKPNEIEAVLQSHCQPEILKQYPGFNDIDISMLSEETYWAWLAKQKSNYGAFITISAIS